MIYNKYTYKQNRMTHRFSRKVKRKNKKTLRRRYKLHGGAGSPKSSKTPEEYNDADLLTPPEKPPSSSSSMVRGRRGIRENPMNPMKWLGHFQGRVARRLSANASAAEPFVPVFVNYWDKKITPVYHTNGMTPRQRRFIQNIATRKSFTNEMMKRIIQNKLPYDAKVAEYLKEVGMKRVVKALLLDTTAPYALERVIVVGDARRYPRCAILDPDGNIVVTSNPPTSSKPITTDHIQVFRYSDGAYLKAKYSSLSRNRKMIGDIAFREGDLISPDEDDNVEFLNYSNNKDKGSFHHRHMSNHGITVAPDGGIIMCFNDIGLPIIVRFDDKGNEIGSLNGSAFYGIGGLAFDPQGRLVVASSKDNSVNVYDYKPYDPENIDTVVNFITHWNTFTFNEPRSVAFNRNGNLLVLERSGLLKILKYPEGSLIQSIDCKATSDTSQCAPTCVSAGHNGDIMVCDRSNMCIKIFTQL